MLADHAVRSVPCWWAQDWGCEVSPLRAAACLHVGPYIKGA